MGNMYKEVIFRKRLPVFIVFFVVMIIVLYLLKIAEIMNLIPIHMARIIDIFCLFTLISFAIYEIKKCQVQYKYSIIGEQLIIHRVKGKSQKLVEDIKIQDIRYIGPISKRHAVKWGNKRRNYICSLINLNKHCCIYADGHKSHEVYFEPSSELIEKIKIIKNKQKVFQQQRSLAYSNISSNKIYG
jgi:hypothetical protein